MFGVKPRAAGTKAGEVLVLDTSAILDGRIESLLRMGFLAGTLLSPSGVLEELQPVADSSDPARRQPGPRALDLLVALRRDPAVDVQLVEDAAVARPQRGRRRALVRLARARGAALVTNDANLAKVAQALDVPVRSIHALADAMRPPVVAGEHVRLRLIREGRDARARPSATWRTGPWWSSKRAGAHVGETVEVTVTNVLQTSNGQLIFGQLADEPSRRGRCPPREAAASRPRR